MVTTAESGEFENELICTFGMEFARSATLLTCAAARLSPVTAVTEIGTSCWLWACFCAVTTISFRPPSLPPASWASAGTCANTAQDVPSNRYDNGFFMFFLSPPALFSLSLCLCENSGAIGRPSCGESVGQY